MLSYLLAALVALFPTPAGEGPMVQPIIHKPTLSLSSVREIECMDGSGSGFLVGNNTLATALHVANGTKCIDSYTRMPLTTYHRDEVNDFALMTGPYPSNMPYVKVDCSGFKTGQEYFSFGWRNFFRLDRAEATPRYTRHDFRIKGKSWPGMRVLDGGIVPGMSGGPITNNYGYATGINNVGEWNEKGDMIHTMSYELKNTILCKNK